VGEIDGASGGAQNYPFLPTFSGKLENGTVK
jgi:hypothetical protein